MWLTELFQSYYESLEDSRKRLLARYRLVDVAHKVVGVGSVGTRCFISYWEGNDEGDPLFLQVKQANASLLEPYLGRSEYDAPGTTSRYRAAADAGDQRYLPGLHAVGRARLLRAAALRHERFGRPGHDPGGLPGALCRALWGGARPRPRPQLATPAEIAGYLGKSNAFDKALVEFAFRYADQNDADYAAFKQAVAEGRLEARAEDQIKVPAKTRTMTAPANGKPIRSRR